MVNASPEGADSDVILQLLGQVSDPEVPVLSILDLGIVRSWQHDENGVEVVITPTYSGCPAMDTIEADIQKDFPGSGLPEYSGANGARSALDHRLDERGWQGETSRLWHCASGIRIGRQTHSFREGRGSALPTLPLSSNRGRQHVRFNSLQGALSLQRLFGAFRLL